MTPADRAMLTARRRADSPSRFPLVRSQGFDETSVVNCDRIHTVSQRRLTRQIGVAPDEAVADICAVIAIALGCDGP